MRSCEGSCTPGRYSRFSLSLASRSACSAVRASSVARRPLRASSTPSAVPNDPAPMTVARLGPGVGSERVRGARTAGLGVGSGAVIR